MQPNTFCAVASADNSKNTVWSVQIIGFKKDDKENITDDYNNIIMGGADYLVGHYLEEVDSNKKGLTFEISKKCFIRNQLYILLYKQRSLRKDVTSINDYVDILSKVK